MLIEHVVHACQCGILSIYVAGAMLEDTCMYLLKPHVLAICFLQVDGLIVMCYIVATIRYCYVPHYVWDS